MAASEREKKGSRASDRARSPSKTPARRRAAASRLSLAIIAILLECGANAINNCARWTTRGHHVAGRAVNAKRRGSGDALACGGG
ncbi:unnamed protein product [Lampetra planeri]